MLCKKRLENGARAEEIYDGNAENYDLNFEEFRIVHKLKLQITQVLDNNRRKAHK